MKNRFEPRPLSPQRQAAAKKIIEESGSIAASPPVAFQIFNLTRQPEYSNEEMVRLIEVDPELTAQVLRLVNSVQLRGRGIASVAEAVMRLGAREVTNLAMSLTVGRLISMSHTSYCPNPEALWRHCVGCALACDHLVKLTKGLRVDRELVFTTGLLHDIGKIVINNSSPFAVEVIAEAVREEDMEASDAELAVLGADHAEIGGQLLELWNLPLELTQAVRFHHAPDLDHTGLANLVHVGNCCAKVHAGSRGWQDFQESLMPHALDRLGISVWHVEDAWSEALQSMDAIERFVGC